MDLDAGAFEGDVVLAPEFFATGADGLTASLSGAVFTAAGLVADGSTAGDVTGSEDVSGAETASGAVTEIGVGAASVVWLRRTPRMPAAPADTTNAAAAAAMNPEP